MDRSISMKSNYALIPKTKEKTKQNSFDWLFVKRLASIARILFRDWIASSVLLTLLISSLLQTWVISKTGISIKKCLRILLGEVNGGFYQSIVYNDKKLFISVVYLSIGVVSSSDMNAYLSDIRFCFTVQHDQIYCGSISLALEKDLVPLYSPTLLLWHSLL